MNVDFPWETLRAIIGGRSAVDVDRLHLDTLDKATAFLESYGYRWHVADDRDRLLALKQEAVSFLDELLRDLPTLSVPDGVRTDDDVRQLLVTVSTGNGPRQAWSCALLRVMHVLNHAETYIGVRFREAIRDQIVTRFERHITGTGDTLQLGTEADGVRLAAFEVKHAKTRWSTAMKLLHKADNVAAQIFDRVGVRLVTRQRFDALRVVRFLHVHGVINFANVMPSRSVNTLIRIDDVQQKADALAQSHATDAEQLAALYAFVAAEPYPEATVDPVNRFSALDYHAIQFTCRQLIRATDDEPANSFFFPFEVQVLDAEAMAISHEGLASHGAYKARQRREAQRRVLRDLLPKP